MPDTAALTNFRASLALANELMQIEAVLPDPAPPADEARARGLRGGAAVLMVAAFEGYLSSGIAELVYPLLGPPAKLLNTLPKKLQTASVYESLELAMYGPRHGQTTTKEQRLPDIDAAVSKISSGLVDPAALSQTKSNPSPATVKRLLKGLGIPDPFAYLRPTFDLKWAQPEAASFLVDKLEEIVQRRHRVAHSANALAIGRADLAAGAKFLQTLAETIDQDVQIYLAAL
ncbi:hypothetical protein ETAA8_01960 [Anatilimnocola aggregata]|uniref:RiboL-PSP-HEPN domain-containing protein n=1 Tax=Anatilimnocola aggregata TaxID=2528021 RepID=A0A517Y4H8_9BACT|nr:HEPN domain-containing protein [Anatilimnocola aggregata]QDU25135.1 hypothetical protein ETAA8_01960 [Anatilimnocola aggregata]